jgi:hypothetical protein
VTILEQTQELQLFAAIELLHLPEMGYFSDRLALVG